MADDIYDDILSELGFGKIGQLDFRLHLQVWWHEEAKIQVIVFPLGSKTLIKGCKDYYLKSITEQGETWARDIGPLQDYLEAHFQEVHLSFSFFRDIPPQLATTQIRRKMKADAPTKRIPDTGDIAKLQRQLEYQRRQLQSAQDLIGLDSGSSELIRGWMNHEVEQHRRSIQVTQDQLQRQQEQVSLFRNLQKEYERKGTAVTLVFSISSNIQSVSSPSAFRDAVCGVVKELADLHRYQVSQKLSGGKLNIQVAEAQEPVLVWIEEWFGGALSPRQLAKLGAEFDALRQAMQQHTTVVPREDIRIDDVNKDDRKLLAGRVVSTLVRRLDKPHAGLDLKDLPDNALPAKIGLTMRESAVTGHPAIIPLSRLDNMYISGATGSGKSYLGRVVTEEASQYEQLNILVLDPRNQAAGLTVPEDRDSILSMYDEFGLEPRSARGFDFQYYAPNAGEELPADLGQLGLGRSIVSFKALDDAHRCTLFAQVLDAVFEAHAVEESSALKLILLVEEAQRFTKKRVGANAKAAGQAAEVALDRTLREGRKYGCCSIIVSQTIRDFAYDTASIRQNTNTKAFLHNSDREVDYAADFIGDGRQIIQLTTGSAMVYNAAWGIMKVKVRPPYSKVWEFSAADTAKLRAPVDAPKVALSEPAQRLLTVVHQHRTSGGSGLNLTEAGQTMGVSSKRMLQGLVDELERGGFVRTRKLRQRGQPRIIEPIGADHAGQTPDSKRSQGGLK